jgi:catechol 2,3-dioxygenase-like lactoylglutathione lyase family enzyme
VKLMPIRYCEDVAASSSFYRALGLDGGPVSRPGEWAELPAATGMLALHQATESEKGHCELAFEADEPLEDITRRLRDAGFEPDAIIDEAFGRSVRVLDPDGIWVQVNEHDRELYT